MKNNYLTNFIFRKRTFQPQNWGPISLLLRGKRLKRLTCQLQLSLYFFFNPKKTIVCVKLQSQNLVGETQQPEIQPGLAAIDEKYLKISSTSSPDSEEMHSRGSSHRLSGSAFRSQVSVLMLTMFASMASIYVAGR